MREYLEISGGEMDRNSYLEMVHDMMPVTG